MAYHFRQRYCCEPYKRFTKAIKIFGLQFNLRDNKMLKCFIDMSFETSIFFTFFLANGIKGQQYNNKIAGGFLKINFRIC